VEAVLRQYPSMCLQRLKIPSFQAEIQAWEEGMFSVTYHPNSVHKILQEFSH
jgi:hypothetical protein